MADGQGAPWWQYALPLFAGVASAASPALARGAGGLMSGIAFAQGLRQQSREDEERQKTRVGLYPIIDVLKSENTPPFAMTPQASDIMAQGGVNPGPRMSAEEAEIYRVRARHDPYGVAEQLQEVAGRRPVRLQQATSLEALQAIAKGLQPGEEISSENIAKMPGAKYRRTVPQPATIDDPFDLWYSRNPKAPLTDYVPPAQPKEKRYVDWGHGQKKVINPDGTETIERVPTAPRETVGGLSPAAQRRVDSAVNHFDSLPIVKKAQTMAEAVDFAGRLDLNTKNPADDQGLIYAFAKAMDPDSVVREGEYAVIQKYSQSWLERFGFNAQRVLSNTEFLTPQARANMKATIGARYGPIRRQYDNVRKNVAQRLDRIVGPGQGVQYLNDYAAAFPGGEAETAPGAAPGQGGAGASAGGKRKKYNPATDRAE